MAFTANSSNSMVSSLDTTSTDDDDASENTSEDSPDPFGSGSPQPLGDGEFREFWRLRGILVKLKHHTPPHMLPPPAPVPAKDMKEGGNAKEGKGPITDAEKEATAELAKDNSIKWNGKVIRSAILLSDGSESKYLSDFKEIKFIGDGGFGIVAKCINNIDEKEYAVKKVSIRYSRTFADLLREVHALSSMRHPNVVQYYQAWVESMMSGCTSDLLEEEDIQSPCLYILMELCITSLFDFISKKPAYDALILFRQILQGVQHVHNQGFIHGDLSTGNIFLDKEHEIKIGDFGLARLLGGEQTNYSNSDGNKVYKAPEKRAGNLMTSKCDVFSLGLILMELLHPFATVSERNKVLGDVKQFNIADRLEDEFTPLIRKMISATPSDRPGISEVFEELDALNN
ncbi:mitosis inhibitor protein kinase swe1 [Castilleja foliolosa]|uniref:Mitosis inhibitor protein kinase swe1 n=1 Tax=Castilleja foliolosa TaxID=1961234 RepID=A0ABD3DMU2_9LAMI